MTDLLTPRFIVKGPYPDSPYETGEILIRKDYPSGNYCYSLPDGSVRITKEKLESCPNIFQPLPWWSHRDLADMPEYLKVNTSNTALFMDQVVRVKMWKINAAGHFYCYLIEDRDKSLSEMYRYSPEHFLPATLEDYNLYLQTKGQ